MGIRRKIYALYSRERRRQFKKWGMQDHPLFDLMNLQRNVKLRKSYQEAYEEATKEGNITWEDILLEEVWEALSEESPYRQIEELVQVGAVVTAILEKLLEKVGEIE